jgi:3D (Asp-Asp-Asp) domain-containing protein
MRSARTNLEAMHSEDAATRLAQSQMRRDGTARAVLSLLAVTGVVVSAIVAKQATVSRQAAFASPPMLDVQSVSLAGGERRASMSLAEREAEFAAQVLAGRVADTQMEGRAAEGDGRAWSLQAVVWPERISAASRDFVGPRTYESVKEQVPSLAGSRVDDAGSIELDASVRWFHGRPVKPKRVLWMRVTAYSPDERSCPGTADGFTATMHCVTTNNGLLVAADPAVLPMGSMLSVPGYGTLASGEEAIVPVLDVGGAIKGERLDLLFATHEAALQWGVRELPVVIWEYVDGKPFANPRQAR